MIENDEDFFNFITIVYRHLGIALEIFFKMQFPLTNEGIIEFREFVKSNVVRIPTAKAAKYYIYYNHPSKPSKLLLDSKEERFNEHYKNRLKEFFSYLPEIIVEKEFKTKRS